MVDFGQVNIYWETTDLTDRENNFYWKFICSFFDQRDNLKIRQAYTIIPYTHTHTL